MALQKWLKNNSDSDKQSNENDPSASSNRASRRIESKKFV